MIANTVKLNQTYWTIISFQHGDTTTLDSIIVLPVTVLYIEQKEHPKQNEPRLCVCAAIDPYGVLPEMLAPRKIKECFLYETFEEAWSKLEDTFQHVISDTAAWRHAIEDAHQDINEPSHCLTIALNTYPRNPDGGTDD
jgi:hypothetical protein